MEKKKLIKWLKILTVVFSVVTIALVYYELKFFDILLGVYQLEIKNKPIAKISQKSLIYVMRSKDPQDLFIEEMEKFGWRYYDTYGRGYLFTKQGEEILATQSKHFGRYTVYEIHNKKYFNYMNEES